MLECFVVNLFIFVEVKCLLNICNVDELIMFLKIWVGFFLKIWFIMYWVLCCVVVVKVIGDGFLVGIDSGKMVFLIVNMLGMLVFK